MSRSADRIEVLPAWARGLLAESRVARMGLLDDTLGPRVLPVTYVLHAGALWTAVDDKPKLEPGREPARVRFLRDRPRAALTVDHYADDWKALAWVQALGSVAVLTWQEEPAALDALVAKYAPYRQRPPRGPLLRLTPDRLLFWRAADDPARPSGRPA